MIPEEAQRILLDMGKWLDTSGEAIYGTRAWKVFGEGPTEVISGGFTDDKSKAFTSADVRFTRKGNVLYAIALDKPTAPLAIQSLGKTAGLLDGKIASIRLLGSTEKVVWSQGDSALTIQPPTGGGPYAWAYRIDLQ